MLFVNNFYYASNEAQRKRWLPDVLTGLWLNVRVWLAASVLMLVFGTGLAVVRTLTGPATWPKWIPMVSSA